MDLSVRPLTTVLVCTSNAGKMREFAAAWSPAHRIIGLADLSAEQRKHYGEPCEDGDSFVHNGLIKLVAAMESFVHTDPTEAPDVIVVDDSGLVVPELDHRPGVHSAMYSGAPRDDARNRARLAAEVHAHQHARIQDTGERRLDAYFVAALLACDWRGLGFGDRAAMAARCRDVLKRSGQSDSAEFPFRAWESRVFRRCEREGLDACVPFGGAGDQNAPHPEIKMSYGFCRGTVSDTEQQLLKGEGHGYDALFFPVEFPQLSFASIALAEKNRLSHRGRALAALLPVL